MLSYRYFKDRDKQDLSSGWPGEGWAQQLQEGFRYTSGKSGDQWKVLLRESNTFLGRR